jgi:hypothetical protein
VRWVAIADLMLRLVVGVVMGVGDISFLGGNVFWRGVGAVNECAWAECIARRKRRNHLRQFLRP